MGIQLRRIHQDLSDGILVVLPDSRRASHGQVGCLEKYESVQSTPFPCLKSEISEIRPESVDSIKAERLIPRLLSTSSPKNSLRAAHTLCQNDTQWFFWKTLFRSRLFATNWTTETDCFLETLGTTQSPTAPSFWIDSALFSFPKFEFSWRWRGKIDLSSKHWE